MTDKVVIFVTAANRRQSKKIARHLVENRLAACVNIIPVVESIYRWKGKVADERECLLILKSVRKLFPEIKAAILKIHTYDTPEVLCLPIIDGSQDYLEWISGSVKPAAPNGAG